MIEGDAKINNRNNKKQIPSLHLLHLLESAGCVAAYAGLGLILLWQEEVIMEIPSCFRFMKIPHNTGMPVLTKIIHLLCPVLAAVVPNTSYVPHLPRPFANLQTFSFPKLCPGDHSQRETLHGCRNGRKSGSQGCRFWRYTDLLSNVLITCDQLSVHSL